MFETIIPLLQKAEKIGIFAHENPDGDAMGSAFSLKQTMCNMGKQAEVFLTAKPDSLAYAIVLGKEESGLAPSDCDLLVAVDAADSKRLGEYASLFIEHPNTVAIDHHITHIAFAKETVVKDVSSCCEIMTELYKELKSPITKEIAHNLYLGMVCDTGRFQYSAVTAKTLRIAAELIEAGADFTQISKQMFDSKTREYYSLMQTALRNLAFYRDGKICVLYLSPEDFAAAGLEEADAGGIVTLPGNIAGVSVGVYIREREQGAYKISLRSSGKVNVAEIAAAFGGGGHLCASGYSVLDATVAKITEDVVREIQKQLKEEAK